MKNLIKLSFYLLSFTFLLGSCGGESSTKGHWSYSDMDRCTSDMISEMKADSESEEMMEAAGTSYEEFAACACKKFAEIFDSYSIADADESMTDEEAGMLILSCFGDMEDLIRLGLEMEEDEVTTDANSEGGWTEMVINEYMTECAIDPAMEGYCSCILAELIEKYTIEEASLLTEEDFANLDSFEDCLELIEY